MEPKIRRRTATLLIASLCLIGLGLWFALVPRHGDVWYARRAIVEWRDAERHYRENSGKPWLEDVAGLHYAVGPEGTPMNLLSKAIADADAEPRTKRTLEPVPYHGYLFRIAREEREGGTYALWVFPADPEEGSKLTWFYCEGGTFCGLHLDSPPPRGWPPDEIFGKASIWID